MKKWLGALALLSGLLTFTTSNQAAEAATVIKVFVEDEQVTFDQQPIMKNNRVLVPFRQISEAVGANVKWNNTTKTMTVTTKEKTLTLKANTSVGYVNGTPKGTDVPIQIIKGRTYIPLRFLSEGLGAKVNWDGSNKEVHLTVWENLYDKVFVTDAVANIDREFPIDDYEFLMDNLEVGTEVVNSMIYGNLIDQGDHMVVSEHYALLEIDGVEYGIYMLASGEYENGYVNGDYTIEVYDTETNELAFSDEGIITDKIFSENLKFSSIFALKELGYIE